jgi:putative transposase
MKKRFSEGQIVRILAEATTGTTVTEVCRTHNINAATFYTWRKQYRSMNAAEVRELKSLPGENHRLKRLLAERDLEIDALKEALGKNWEHP